MFAIFIYLLSALFLLYEMALQVSPSVMTEHLMLDFNVGAGALGVMAAFYFYSYTLMQIPVGLLFDRFNARWLISGAVFLCALGTFFFGLADGVAWASAGRFLMGIGSAFAFVGVLVVASRWFPPRYFAFLVGVAQFLAAMGALAGELPLSWLLEHFSWRVVMVILGGIGIILTLLCAGVVRDHPNYQRHHNLLAELKEIVRSGQTWWVGLYAFCGWAPVAVFAALWGVPYLKVRFDVSTTEAAWAMALVWIGIGVTSPILGWISDKIGRRKVLLTTCSSIGLLSALILFYLPVTFGFSFFLLFGIGIAAGGQILSFAVVKDNNRHSVVGTAVGLNNMAVVAGGALFQPLVGYLLQMYWTGGRDGSGAPLYSIENYHVGLIVVPLSFLVGVISSLFFIKETYCKQKYDATV